MDKNVGMIMTRSLGFVGTCKALIRATESLSVSSSSADLFNQSIGKLRERKTNRNNESRTRCAEYSPNSPEVILMTKQFWQSVSQKNSK